ncbi:MAG: glycosyltransferase [Bacteroidia bacterium]|nr:glycosyltransferase [Bacteroidia bacterium]
MTGREVLLRGELKRDRKASLYIWSGDCPYKPKGMPHIIHCIIHNLVYDQRLHKLALTTRQVGVTEVIGIISPRTKANLPGRPYSVRRLWVPVGRGPLFFLIANLRFFLHLLLRRRWDAVIASDLAALPGCWLAAKLRRKVILLDSRELFTQTPFLVHRPLVRWLWERAERFLYARVHYTITVSPPIARYFERKYRRPVWLVYNFPPRGQAFASPCLADKLLLYQGMLHPYRGLEELILALREVAEWKLWIIGDGPLRSSLEHLVEKERLGSRVQFFGIVPFELLERYTRRATFGVSGEIPVGLNHKYALPNKLFDYLREGIPVLGGEAPLVQRVIRHYECGKVIAPWTPGNIVQILQGLSQAEEEYKVWVEGARRAAQDLHWEKQAPCIHAWVSYALSRSPLPPQREVGSCASIQAFSTLLESSEV